MIVSNVLRAQVMRQSFLTTPAGLPRVAASVVVRRFYAPQVIGSHSASAKSHHARPVTAEQILDQRHPMGQNEALSSIIDGELDYDTDMGAAAVNNVTAERRAEALAKAEKIARDTDEFARRNYS